MGAVWEPLGASLGLLRASRGTNTELFTLRESPPAHPKTATFAKCTAYRELSVCALCLSTGGQRERRLRSRARRRRRQESISRLLRSFALGASCKPLGAIVGPSWGHVGSFLGPLGAVLGLSWGALGALLGPSWRHWRQSWGNLGGLWGSLGPSWGALGGSLGAFLGALGGPLGAILEAIDQKRGGLF